MNTEIIDVCTQLGSGDKKGDILEYGITVQKILDNMDYANVLKSIIYPITWDDYKSKANLEIYEATLKYPDRFIGFARVNPNSKDAEEILIEALDKYNFKGIRLRGFHDQFTMDSKGVKRMFDIAKDRKIPVAVDGEKDKSTLLKLVKAHPNLTIIIMHMGSFDNWDWKNTKVYVELIQEIPNFYMASCFFIIQSFLQDALNKAPNKIVFGSDSPTLPPSMELKRIETMGLSPDKFAMVIGGNITRLLIL